MVDPPRVALVYDAVYPFQKGGGERRFHEIARRLDGAELYGMKGWPDSLSTKPAWSSETVTHSNSTAETGRVESRTTISSMGVFMANPFRSRFIHCRR